MREVKFFTFLSITRRVSALDIERMLAGRFTRRDFKGVLQQTVLVRDIEEVEASFHARMGVKRKTYSYLICEGTAPPLRARYCWSLLKARGALNVTLMQSAAAHLVNVDCDYRRFAIMQDDDDRPTVRKLSRFDVEVEENGVDGMYVRVTISCDFFLYRMVRRIVGTLVQVGIGKMPMEAFEGLLACKDVCRHHVVTAPARGLVLENVEYE